MLYICNKLHNNIFQHASSNLATLSGSNVRHDMVSQHDQTSWQKEIWRVCSMDYISPTTFFKGNEKQLLNL